MMFYQFLSRIIFLCKSTNEHGIHSPFVFNLTTKGLYSKNYDTRILKEYNITDDLNSKEQKILSKILNYLDNDSKYRCHTRYFSSPLEANQTELKGEFWIIRNIHSSKNELSRWNQLIVNDEASVTIDLYYFGLIFYRRNQEKEHFIIRV